MEFRLMTMNLLLLRNLLLLSPEVMNILRDWKGKNLFGIRLPSADSVQVLLKQALHAEDHSLLLDCLYNQDEKVIANSISLLNPADTSKLLNSLITITQSSVWSIGLNIKVVQLFPESRVSTLRPALQLASHLDLLDAWIEDGEVDEFDSITPAIYEDKDSEDESEHAMDTDEEDNKNEDLSDIGDD
ncbi:hypothetical protein Dimus_010924 [Dionaea muscipula]